MRGDSGTEAAVLHGLGLRMVLPGLAMIGATYGLARFSYGLFLPEFRHTFQLDSSLLGLIGGGSFLGYCLSISLSGMLCIRWGPRPVVVLAGAVATGGMCAVAAAPSSSGLAIGVLVAGTSAGLASPPMGDAVQARIAEPHQSVANTWINSGTSLGVLLSGCVAVTFGASWRIAWLTFAAAALLTTVWCYFSLPATSIAAELSSGDRRVYASNRPGPAAWFTRQSLPLLLSSCGMGLVSAIYWTFSRDLIVTNGIIGKETSTVFWIVIGISGFAGGFAGSLVHHRGLTFALRGCLVGLGISVVLLALAPGALILTFVSAVAFGICYILLCGIYLVWGVTVFPHQPSLGIALSFATIAVGQVIGSPLAGSLATVLGLPAVFWIFGMFSGVAALIRPARESLTNR